MNHRQGYELILVHLKSKMLAIWLIFPARFVLVSIPGAETRRSWLGNMNEAHHQVLEDY